MLRALHVAASAALALGAVACSAPALASPRPDVEPPRPVLSVTRACTPTVVKVARELLPEDAVAVVGVDVDSLRVSPVFADVEPMLRATPQVALVLASLERCGVGLDVTRAFTLGVSEGGDLLAVVKADRLGTPATLDCVSRRLESAIGMRPWTRRTHRCHTEIQLAGGQGAGVVVDEDTVAIASRGWALAVAGRAAGHGQAAWHGTLAWASAAVDTARSTWMAAAVPSWLVRAHGAGLRRVGGSLDLRSGLELELGLDFASVAEASRAALELERERRKLQLAAPMFGVPPGVVAGIGVVARATRIDVRVKISAADLRELRRIFVGEAPPGRRAPI